MLMRNVVVKTLFSGLLLLFALGADAQEMSEVDSLKAVNDSIILQLRQQVQELKLQGIMMQEQLERNVIDDSLRIAERKARVDSLRKIVSGAPLVIGGDTLLVLYARRGGMLPEDRVADAKAEIISLGKRLTLFLDSMYVFEGEYSSDVMAGEQVILSLTDIDGLWQNTTRQELAAKYCEIIKEKCEALHAEYGLKQKLKGLFLVVLILVAQWLVFRGTRWLYRRWRFRLLRRVMRMSLPLVVKDYEVLNLRRQGVLFLFIFKALFYAVVFLQLLFTIPLLFSVFPETETFAYTILGYILSPIKDILRGIVSYLPNLFKIIVIIVCFHYLVKAVRYLSNEVASGRMKINGFYADWAQPTYLILRVLLYSFMLVMIWPLLPSSNSEIFQGVSVFIGIIISLGSTSIIGNLMAGLAMTYMRPFHVGDFIRFGDVEGFVLEKTVLVTRIRTRKNEVITIPNSTLMNSQTSNFTFAAENYGVIVHTKVTIGYDMQHELIENLLLEAATDTPLILKKPQPFVGVTALDDFYVEYEINAYTTHSDRLSQIYSKLHQNILDHFHEAGVEIMSPHIFAHRDNLEVQIPKRS